MLTLPDHLSVSKNCLAHLQRVLRHDRTVVAVNAIICLFLIVAPFLEASSWTARLQITGWIIFFTAICVAGYKSRTSPWVRFIALGEKHTGLSASDAMKSFTSDSRLSAIATCTCLALVLSEVARFFQSIYLGGGLAAVMANCFLLSLLLPATSVIGLLIAQRIRISHEKPYRLIGKINRKFTISIRSFLIKRNPYFSAYAGFACFCALVAGAPNGLGATLFGWISDWMFDANITTRVATSSLPVIPMVVDTATGLLLFGCSQKVAIRLSAGFQALTVRMCIHKENLLEAFMDTATVKSTNVEVPELHPHLNNISSTFCWLLFCYMTLFYLIAFCPDPLGAAIYSWLNASIFDAGFNLHLSQHHNLRLFLASVVAGYGAVPLAVTSSVFLPQPGSQRLIVSEKGLLSPQICNPAQAPLKLWEDLKTVSLKNQGKNNETINLSFKHGGTIKLKTAGIAKDKVAELLATADEYATQCAFDANVIALRSKLTEESRAGTLADQRKFASTIFSPKRCGDQLHNQQYRIIRKLAGKPLCAVYLARDKQNFLVVIKEFVLPTCVTETEAMEQNFNREFNILSALKHHAIASVIETFEENEAKYIVIEHIEGNDLRTIVQKRGNRNEKTLLRWAEQIALLMQILHSQETPILHRDLTPDNLIEDADGNIKLIDFGAAHQFLEGVTGTLIGKQCYIAPEQLRGKPCIQSDIYSFGCTLYFIAAGRDPIALQQSDLGSSQTRVSDSLVNLVKRCTEFEVENRIQSFDEIIRELQSSRKVIPKQAQKLNLLTDFKTDRLAENGKFTRVEHS